MPKGTKPVWAGVNDLRVTRVGKIIRKLRLDEIPQVINVLKGEMSFVGPRPERPFFTEKLTQEIPFYTHRHTVKPGITGWAQICYPYGHRYRTPTINWSMTSITSSTCPLFGFHDSIGNHKDRPFWRGSR